jgi:hypothetical protein
MDGEALFLKKIPLLAILQNHKLHYRSLVKCHQLPEECTNENLRATNHFEHLLRNP